MSEHADFKGDGKDTPPTKEENEKIGAEIAELVAAQMTGLAIGGMSKKQNVTDKNDKDSLAFPMLDWGLTQLANSIEKAQKQKPTEVTYKDGTSVQFAYDADGRVTSYKDRDGVKWTRDGASAIFSADGTPSKRQQLDINVTPDGSFSLTTGDGIIRRTNAVGVQTVEYPKLDVKSFQALLDRNWSRLDRDGNGRISRDEIDMAVTDNSFTGQDAQMVVALKKKTEDLLNLDGLGVYKQFLNIGLSKDDMQLFDQMRSEVYADVAHNAKVTAFLQTRFDQYDTDKDGKLSYMELLRARLNSASKEESDNIKEILANFTDLQSWIGNDISRADLIRFSVLPLDNSSIKVASDLSSSLTDARDVLNKANSKLYASDNAVESIKPDAIKQGEIGDCYFLASLASVAQKDPDSIKDMIRPNKDGTYTVTFPGDKDNPVTVNAPTEAEIALYAQGNQYGIWPAVIEKAFGKWKGGTIVPQEGADGGGMMEDGVHILTDRSTVRIDTDDSMLEWTLNYAQSHHVPLVADVKEGHGSGLPTDHAYSVLDYDGDKKIVTVRNPWGYRELRDEHGHALDGVDDGVFKVSLEDFQKHFAYMAVPSTSEIARTIMAEHMTRALANG
jgi:YD repeat-containing protein